VTQSDICADNGSHAKLGLTAGCHDLFTISLLLPSQRRACQYCDCWIPLLIRLAKSQKEMQRANEWGSGETASECSRATALTRHVPALPLFHILFPLPLLYFVYGSKLSTMTDCVVEQRNKNPSHAPVRVSQPSSSLS